MDRMVLNMTRVAMKRKPSMLWSPRMETTVAWKNPSCNNLNVFASSTLHSVDEGHCVVLPQPLTHGGRGLLVSHHELDLALTS